MELKALSDNFTKLFGSIEKFNIEHLTEENCNKYLKLINEDLNTDYLRKMWQFYMADREEKKQDFTPESLGNLLAELTRVQKEKWVLDMCSGSGSLTIQKWSTNKNLKFICIELDKDVIPFLLFNLKIRNIEGYVIQGNAINMEFNKFYELKKGKKFSEIKVVDKIDFPEIDSCISNPPFNLTVEAKNENLNLKNANYIFICNAIKLRIKKGAFILPLGTFTSEDEKIAREYLINSNKLKAIITNPDAMFESTSIPTGVLVIEDNNKNNIVVIDSKENKKEKIREQRGEDHTRNRVYKKILNVYTKENINKIIESMSELIDEDNFSKVVIGKEIADNNYKFQPSNYITYKKETYYRSYRDIVADLQHIIELKNSNRLVANETWARQLGINIMKEDIEKDNDLIDGINDIIQKVLKFDMKLEKQRWLTVTKSKELRYENNNKEKITEIMMDIVKQWQLLIKVLNNEENILLQEFKQKLTPDLLSGKLDVSDF